MYDREIEADRARALIEEVLRGAKDVIFATNGSHGHPNVRTMYVACHDGAEALWFTTSLESSKIIELIKNEKAAIYIKCDGNAEVRLWGKVVILDDRESRERVWCDDLRAAFPDGAHDPNMRVLRFDVISGLYAKEGRSGIFTR